MSTVTPALKLPIPGTGDRNWNVQIANGLNIIDALGPAGNLYCSTHEQPSISLLVDIEDGFYLNQSNVVSTFAGSSGVATTGSTTNYIYLTNAGSLVVNATGFPAAPNLYIPIATVQTSSSTVINITDYRTVFAVAGAGYLPLGGGTMSDGANIAIGTTTGSQIGTATNQKIGLWGKTPVVQPTMGSSTASGSYTSVEQGMIQTMWNLLRTIGAGS